MFNLENRAIVLPSRKIISNGSFIFLYCLLKKILVTDSKYSKKNNKLSEYFSLIKEKYNIQINKEYTLENFKNISEYIETQNLYYAGEILESIIIQIISINMNIDVTETINKYIFLDLDYFEKSKEQQEETENFIISEKFYQDEMKSKFNIIINEINNNKILSSILHHIGTLQFKKIKKKEIKSKNIESYILSINDSENNKLNREKNSILFFKEKITDNERYFNFVKNIYLSSFIYHQTNNYPLINEINDGKNLNEFSYNFKSAYMNGQYSMILYAPIRQDKRIKKVLMTENKLGELGMYELGKTIIFNKYIKTLIYNRNIIKSFYLFYLKEGMKIFDNYSIEKFDLSSNYFKFDTDKCLCNIIKKFKGLKALDLPNNQLGGSIVSFLILLRNLYLKGESQLTKLNLSKCFLNTESYYELAELLKCKKCKLKYLYLNVKYVTT